jgi:hypothetical protein
LAFAGEEFDACRSVGAHGGSKKDGQGEEHGWMGNMAQGGCGEGEGQQAIGGDVGAGREEIQPEELEEDPNGDDRGIGRGCAPEQGCGYWSVQERSVNTKAREIEEGKKKALIMRVGQWGSKFINAP